MSRLETLLNALVNGETADIIPQSRNEEYLLALINCDTEVKEPRSRMEAYLHALCKNGVAGGGSDGGGSDGEKSQLDALISGEMTDITSFAESVREKAFYQVPNISRLYLPRATTIGKHACYQCENLVEIDLPNATTIKESAFKLCTALVRANCPAATKLESYVFNDCTNLVEVNLPQVKTAETGMISNSKITSINLPSLENAKDTFLYNNNELTLIDFRSVKKIYSRAVSGSRKLRAVIIRTDTLCALSNVDAFNNCYHFHGTVDETYNPNGDKDGYFYVPRAWLSDDDATKDYRRATNWTTFETQFRALEDYTVDGTIYGELDLTKI